MDDRLSLARDLARKAGAIIKDNFGASHAVEYKADNSPVTAIDIKINELVAAEIHTAFPDDGFHGEEASYGTGNERYQWLCDPLDGTKAYILGIPCSTFMLALSEGGRILLSVVYDPFTDRLYHAVKNNGAYCNGVPMHVNGQKLSEGYVVIGADALPYINDLKEAVKGLQFTPALGCKMMVIANGNAVGMIAHTADIHDFGPGSLIIEESGGKVTDLRGKPIDYSRKMDGVVVSNGVAHDELLRIVDAQLVPTAA